MPRVCSLAASLTIVVMLALVMTLEAEAGRRWCESDPVFTIDDVTYSVEVFGDEWVAAYDTGPIEVDIFVPNGQDSELISTDEGFGYGETVTFYSTGASSPYVRIRVPGSNNGGIVDVDVNGQVAYEFGHLNQTIFVFSLDDYAGLGAGGDTSGQTQIASIGWCRTCD